jgi:hypothetical protein
MGHVAYVREMCTFCSENLNVRDHLVNLSRSMRILLKWLIKKEWIHVTQDKIQMEVSYECGNENFGFIKGRKCHDELSDY